MDIRFDTYYDNDDLNARLHWLAETYPQIARLDSIGKSHEGRDLWLMTITNRGARPELEKPAFWIDGNIHATEVTASMTALKIIVTILSGYGADAKTTRLVDEQVFYILPRMNPDGAALALSKSNPRLLRSGTRPYPFEDPQDGLHVEDIDGDGRILQMRVPDPAGDWKESERDPRLMVKRGPDEDGGRYFRVYAEGRLQEYDGHIVKIAPSHRGLDFNRNFPQDWVPEGKQLGAGPYPASEPEIRAVVDFITRHPNIGGALTYHTSSRVLLRPFSGKSDEEMPVDDLDVYKAIAKRGTELTGYRSVSVFHDFRYHPKQVMRGAFDDWMYDILGTYAFTVELWDLPTAAGIKDRKFMEWYREHPLDDDYAILRWIQEQNGDGGLFPWRAYQHPQLGPIEIGGWDSLFTWINPPPQHLPAEVDPHPGFAIAFAAMLPRLAWRAVEIAPLGDNHYRILAVVENLGFLPTNISQKALEVGSVRPVRFELTFPENATIKGGARRVEVGHLHGRENKVGQFFSRSTPTDNRARAEWIIHAPQGGTLTVTALSERAGTIRRTVDLTNQKCF